MSEDKNHNAAGWRGRLEQLEGLPGELVPDKGKAWEKIYTRLDKKSNRKRPVWYWMAAACLFGLLMAIGLASRKQVSSLVEDNAHQQKPGILPQPPALPKENKSVYAFPLDQSGSKKPELAGSPVKRKDVPVRYMKTEPAPGGSYGSRRDPAITGISNRKEDQLLLVLPDTIVRNSGLVVSVSTKPSAPARKLRVVHINELNDGMEENGSMVNNTGQNRFTIKLTDSDSVNSRFLATRRPGNGKLKIKISPQN